MWPAPLLACVSLRFDYPCVYLITSPGDSSRPLELANSHALNNGTDAHASNRTIFEHAGILRQRVSVTACCRRLETFTPDHAPITFLTSSVSSSAVLPTAPALSPPPHPPGYSPGPGPHPPSRNRCRTRCSYDLRRIPRQLPIPILRESPHRHSRHPRLRFRDLRLRRRRWMQDRRLEALLQGLLRTVECIVSAIMCNKGCGM